MRCGLAVTSSSLCPVLSGAAEETTITSIPPGSAPTEGGAVVNGSSCGVESCCCPAGCCCVSPPWERGRLSVDPCTDSSSGESCSSQTSATMNLRWVEGVVIVVVVAGDDSAV